MTKNIKTIITVCILILIIVLIIVFLNYFENTERYHSKPTVLSGDIASPYEKNDSSKNDDKSGELRFFEDIKDESGEIKLEKSGENIEIEDVSKNENNEVLEDDNKEVTNSNDEIKEEDIVLSGEEAIVVPAQKPEKNKVPNIISSDTIISSDSETSNQEKQEILNEIDDALQGLLEAVGKVQTVDEDKLNASLESRGDY